MRDREPLEQRAGLRLGVARERQQDVLGPDVGGADLAQFLVGGQEACLRVGGERWRNVRALLRVCFLLDLRRDRSRIGPDLPEHVLDDVVLGRRPEEVGRINVEASPLRGLLGRALE